MIQFHYGKPMIRIIFTNFGLTIWIITPHDGVIHIIVTFHDWYNYYIRTHNIELNCYFELPENETTMCYFAEIQRNLQSSIRWCFLLECKLHCIYSRGMQYTYFIYETATAVRVPKQWFCKLKQWFRLYGEELQLPRLHRPSPQLYKVFLSFNWQYMGLFQ